MKKIYFFLLLVSFSSILEAQVVITGTIKNAPNAKIRFDAYTSHLDFKEYTLLETYTDSNGRFQASFNLTEPQLIKLNILEQYTNLFLSDKDNLKLIADYTDFDNTINYKGKGSFNNNYLAADIKENFRYKAAMFLKENNPERFVFLIDSLENSSNNLFLSYDKSKFSDDFLKYFEPELKYRFIDARWSYSMYIDSKTFKYMNRDLPQGYFNFLDKIDLNDQKAAGKFAYNVALMRYFFEKVDKIYSKSLSETIPFEEQLKLRIINGYNSRKKILKGDVLNFELSYYLMLSFIKNIESNKLLFDSLFNDYLVSTNNASYKQILTYKFEKLGAIKYRYISNDIVFENVDGKRISFDELKGKVLYIDFWATWCVPCIANMSDSKKLMNKLKDEKDLVFVYINIKDSKNKWQEYLKKNNIDGVHLFADKSSGDKIYEDLYLSGVPSYIIVGKDGKILNGMALPPYLVESDIIKALSN